MQAAYAPLPSHLPRGHATSRLVKRSTSGREHGASAPNLATQAPRLARSNASNSQTAVWWLTHSAVGRSKPHSRCAMWISACGSQASGALATNPAMEAHDRALSSASVQAVLLLQRACVSEGSQHKRRAAILSHVLGMRASGAPAPRTAVVGSRLVL